MIFGDLAVKLRKKDDAYNVEVSFGKDDPTYWVNFSVVNSYVSTEPNPKVSKEIPIIEIAFPKKIDERQLTEHPVYKGVKYYLFGEFVFEVNSKKVKLIIEYLDTTHGTIPLHSHKKGIREAYLSCKKPYIGTLCSYDESHKPFCNKTLAIKLVDC